jgi:FtsP/CotA-like multicopper oxidase with cupredoxin domain
MPALGLVGSLLTTVLSTVSVLDQTVSNGLSLLGTLTSPVLPKFLPKGEGPFPWGSDTIKNTNPYHDSPNTGVVRKYNFTIARQVLAPDGVEKNMIVVNGQYPGPAIEANWGDIIELSVTNNIEGPEEGTAIHFHGFLQHQTPWMDGTPGNENVSAEQ